MPYERGSYHFAAVAVALRTGIPPAYWVDHPEDLDTALTLLTEGGDPE